MGEEVNIKEILKRIDDLIRVLELVSEDLAGISRILKAYLSSRIEEVTPPIQKARAIDDVQKFFPQDLLGLLYFEVTDDYIIVKPRQYLGSENFTKVAAIVREQLNGEYVSRGKESHFRVPRKI